MHVQTNVYPIFHALIPGKSCCLTGERVQIFSIKKTSFSFVSEGPKDIQDSRCWLLRRNSSTSQNNLTELNMRPHYLFFNKKKYFTAMKECQVWVQTYAFHIWHSCNWNFVHSMLKNQNWLKCLWYTGSSPNLREEGNGGIFKLISSQLAFWAEKEVWGISENKRITFPQLYS